MPDLVVRPTTSQRPTVLNLITHNPQPPQTLIQQVVVRCRPLFGKELNEGRHAIVTCETKSGEIRVSNPTASTTDPPKQFTFDSVYDDSNSQREIYESTALPIVRAAIEGYNGTVFCYGQTGTGKTHTMEGSDEPITERGIIPNAFETVFADIDAEENNNKTFLVRASFLEIYNENVRDLLAKDQTQTCALKETKDKGVYVNGLTTFVMKSADEMRKVLEVGKKNRSVGATAMNTDSSRSHSIFTVTVETSETSPGDLEQDARIRVGKLNLVDLAGSERQSKTNASGDRLKEATKINLSLSALGNVISALVDGKSQHIPYRDSKLTRLLQDSLGGNTKTVMIANVGPADYNFDETMSTLRYANRAKNIKNKPKINEDAKDTMLREFQEEIKRLKAQIEQGGGSGYERRSLRSKSENTNQKTKTGTRLEEIREAMRVEMEQNAMKALGVEDAERAQELARENAREKMRALMEEKDRTEEEKMELEENFRRQQLEMEDHFGEINSEKEEHRILNEKLQAMQAKVVKGGTNLLDQEIRLVEEARIRDERLAKIQAYAAEQKKRIKELEDLDSLAGENYRDIDEEIQSKKVKIDRLEDAYKRAGVDIKDLDDEFVVERDDLLEQVRQLTRKIKLKNLVLDFCVPPEYLADITERCRWDEKTEVWVVEHSAFVGNQEVKRREEEALDVAREMGGVYGDNSEITQDTEDINSKNSPSKNKNKKKKPLTLAQRRLVSAITEVTGDVDRAIQLAWKTENEKMMEVYGTYDEVKASRKKSADRVHGEENSFGDREKPKTSSRRARPGTARPSRRTEGQVVETKAEAEQDAARFPVARGLLKPR